MSLKGFIEVDFVWNDDRPLLETSSVMQLTFRNISSFPLKNMTLPFNHNSFFSLKPEEAAPYKKTNEIQEDQSIFELFFGIPESSEWCVETEPMMTTLLKTFLRVYSERDEIYLAAQYLLIGSFLASVWIAGFGTMVLYFMHLSKRGEDEGNDDAPHKINM